MSTSKIISLEGHEDSIRKVVEIDQYGNLATVSDDGTAKFWSVEDEYCTDSVSLSSGTPRHITAMSDDLVAIVSDEFEITILQVSTLKNLASHSLPDEVTTCTAISATEIFVGDKEGKIFKLELRSDQIFITNERKNAHDNSITNSFYFDILVATSSLDNSVKLWTCENFNLIHTFKGHTGWVRSVSFNESHLVSGSSDGTIRVYDIQTFNHTRTIKRKMKTGFRQILCVKVIRNENVVVSVGDDNIIAIHSLNSGREMSKISIHSLILDLIVLNNGNIVAVGNYPPIVQVIEDLLDVKYIPKPKPIPEEVIVHKPSFMEKSLMDVIENPKSLTIAFLEERIQVSNILSASDLYCGHNIVLLAIRFGILKKEDVIKFKGKDRWFFKDNLYLPASKLINENENILYPIFHHAEDVGIISDGHKFRMEHENRRDTEKRFRSIEESVRELSKRLYGIEEYVGSLSAQVKMIEKSVQRNKENFDALYAAIKKKEKYETYARGAKAVLSLIPIVGGPLGLSTEFLVNISTEAIQIDEEIDGIKVAKTAIDSITNKTTDLRNAKVDLSNLQLAYCLLSEKSINSMDAETKKNLNYAIETSEFKNIENLRRVLKSTIIENARTNRTLSLLDNGTDIWMKEDSGTIDKKSPATIPEPSSSSESPAKLQFRAVSQVRGIKVQGNVVLTIHDAFDALLQTIKTLQMEIQLTEEEFENMFFDISTGTNVSEDDFLMIFDTVSSQANSFAEEQKIMDEFKKAFDKHTRNNTSSVRKAARILKIACEDAENARMKEFSQTSESDIRKMMKAWDKDRSGNIDRDEFASAALEILQNGSTPL